jgi:phosphopantothenoylcysteine decarboxylase/phosphopantothenate--cysteine ligase
MSGHEVPRRLLVGAGGSIAILTLPAYLQAFRQLGVAEISVVLTRSAAALLPAGTLRHICEAAWTDDEPGPGHVALARWADAVIVLPATANLLASAAQGAAPQLLSTILLAAPPPVTLAPMMNPDMWRSAPVRRNVAQLRADGHRVLDPIPGTMFEVASRQLRPGLVLPPPEQFLTAPAEDLAS